MANDGEEEVSKADWSCLRSWSTGILDKAVVDIRSADMDSMREMMLRTRDPGRPTHSYLFMTDDSGRSGNSSQSGLMSTRQRGKCIREPGCALWWQSSRPSIGEDMVERRRELKMRLRRGVRTVLQ